MLTELAVRDLGVIDSARLVLGPGLTALTGETGAGKTMLIEAIGLLLGGRAEAELVRRGAEEAVVEGRFVVEGTEVVLTRVVPREGRSRAYVDGRMVTAAALAERGRAMVDLLGQHAHQALLTTAAQRAALDRAAGIDLAPLQAARDRVDDIDRRLAALGGDAGARARELDLLGYQSEEIVAADLDDASELERLAEEEDRLADAEAHRRAVAAAAEAIGADGGARDFVARAGAELTGRSALDPLVDRVEATVAELEDIVADLHAAAETFVDDPARLEAVRARRQLLLDLVRKYGTASPDATGTLADVIAYGDQVEDRRRDLAEHDSRAAALEVERARAIAEVERAAAAVGDARRRAAPDLARRTTAHLQDLALDGARVEVHVGSDDPGDDVTVLLAPSSAAEPRPVAKAASGGELARTGLALRLVLTADQPCLVFDEVDAGIGGEAAIAVGRALAALGADRQVLVVTHLAQVAAFADAQVGVTKQADTGSVTSGVAIVEGEARVVELSRMLSGTPGSDRVRQAAAELLASAAAEVGRPR